MGMGVARCVGIVWVVVVVHPGAAVVDDDNDDDVVVVLLSTMAQGLTSGACGTTAPMSGGGEDISTIVSMTIQCNSGQSLEQDCSFGSATGMACDGGGGWSKGPVSAA